MLNNFISGGQVFLHKIRMLKQVIATCVTVSIIASLLIIWNLNSSRLANVDWDGGITYAKAKITITLHPALSAIAIGKNRPKVDAYSNGRLYKKNMNASYVCSSNKFQSAWMEVLKTLQVFMYQTLLFSFLIGVFIFLVWYRFGRNLKEDKKQEGDRVLTAREVQRKLSSIGLASYLRIGKMPLVKDMETRHFLICGSTGSGKTNLIDNLLPKIENRHQPAIIIDQTGEMVAKYYNPLRGDIIFNPLDARSKNWNFWDDCKKPEELERFSRILFGFNRKKTNHNSDPFWEQSAEIVFNSCVSYLQSFDDLSIEQLVHMSCSTSIEYLQNQLANTPAARLLNSDGSNATINSILSVLTTSCKPLTYLTDDNTNGRFSLKQYFTEIKAGSKAWLFLATKPSARELTLPLVSCILELGISSLIETGANQNRRIWFVLDEMSSLGKLPALSTLMAEGRKYGACIIAGTQSLNQLYEHYGQYAGQVIFGQFGTAFFFRNNEPTINKMFSSMCGSETIIRQQESTSFGANELRDGVSYAQQQQKKELVEYSHLASLKTGQCYVLLPNPEVRLAKIQVPEAKLANKNEGFCQGQDSRIADSDYPSSRESARQEGIIVTHSSLAISSAHRTNQKLRKNKKKLRNKHLSELQTDL